MHAQECLRCYTVVAPGNRYCPACGLAVGPLACPSCGARVFGGEAFCGQCGSAVTGSSAIEVLTPAHSIPQSQPISSGGSSRNQIATVGLLTIIAAKPLLKIGIVLALGLLLFVGGIRSGLGVTGGALLVLLTAAFLFMPRRRR